MGTSLFKPLHARTLSVHCDAFPALGDNEVLAPVRLRGTEALGKLYRYELDLMTIDSPTLRVYQTREMIQPDKLVGATIDITVEFDGKFNFIPGMPGNTGAGNVGAGTRTITGLIASVQITGSDDRHMYYRFIVRPSLWLTKKTVENRIFQNGNVIEITEEVLADYNVAVEQRLGAPGFDRGYPVRDYVRQYWCPDFDFLTSLWREWGIYYFFEGNTLVLCDSPGAHKKHHNMYDEVRYHAPDGARIDEEHIHRLKVSRAITTGEIDLVDYDYTRSHAIFTGESYGNGNRGPTDHGKHYQWGDYSQPLAGAQGLSGRPNDYGNEADNLANVRLDAMRCRRQRLKGSGNLRGLSTGKTLFLVDHPEPSVNAEYLVVSTTIDIRNNTLETQRVDGEAAYQCVTDFVLQPANTFFKNRLKKKPRAHPETAVVTSYDERTVWPDALARVKVRFVWDRRNKPDLDSSCWLRVSSPWQGRERGLISLPRIGDEVTVDYYQGDPDKPFISGSKVNEFNVPPWKLPDNLALTGVRSRNLDGEGSNQVVTDDTPGKLQVQVASDHGKSGLSVGYNTRIDGTAGRQDTRGEGFELRTDLWGALRAAMGMLITTVGRPGAAGKVKELAETIARLTQARQQHEELSQLAIKHNAQTPDARQSEAVSTIRAQNDAIRGDGGSGNDFPELTRPDMVLASAAGIATTANDSTHMASQNDHAITAGRDVSLSSGRSLLASVSGAISLFAYQLGVRLIAAKGPWIAQAQGGPMSLAALGDVTITSSNGEVIIAAAKRIRLLAGGSYIDISGSGITNGSPGPILEKTPSWDKLGADSKRMPLPVMPVTPLAQNPTSVYSQTFDVSAVAANPGNGPVLANQPYRVYLPDGTIQQQGMLTEGSTLTVNTAESTRVKCEIGSGNWALAEDAYDDHDLEDDTEPA